MAQDDVCIKECGHLAVRSRHDIVGDCLFGSLAKLFSRKDFESALKYSRRFGHDTPYATKSYLVIVQDERDLVAFLNAQRSSNAHWYGDLSLSSNNCHYLAHWEHL